MPAATTGCRGLALDQNGGKARAMNAAAEMTPGAWIAILTRFGFVARQ